MSKENNESLRNLWIISAIIFAVLVIGITCIYFAFSKWDERGQFGDAFGSLNALFSGFAFAGIIYTILLQRKELQLQREELAQTREELRRSADAQERSEIALTKQINSARATAKLNALNILVEQYTREQEHHMVGNSPMAAFKAEGARRKKAEYVEEIEDILVRLDENLDIDNA